MAENDKFLQEKTAAFDQVLAVIAGRAAAIPLRLIVDFRHLGAQAMADGAARESCALFAAGIGHLRSGAPGRMPGSMAEAIAKTSLRSSALAAALGVRAPRFEPLLYDVTYSTGREVALFLTRRLIDAAEGDMMKSAQIIRARIHGGDPGAAFGHFTDPDIARIMEELGRDSARDGGVAPDDLARFKKNMMMSFDALMRAYSDTCGLLRQSLDKAPPAPPKPPAP